MRRVVYEATVATLAIVSVLLAFVSQADVWLEQTTLFVVDAVLVLLQLGDWAFGLHQARRKGRYLLVTAWELPGLLPLFFAAAGPLRLLRLVRLIRVARALGRTHAILVDEDDPNPLLQVHILSLATAGATVLCALMVWIVERSDNEDMRHFTDALWWAVVTVTQVGYGDVVPQTAMGKALAAVLMVGGIAAFVVLLSVISIALVRRTPDRGGLTDQLERLQALRDEGDLDDEEFKAAKARLLER